MCHFEAIIRDNSDKRIMITDIRAKDFAEAMDIIETSANEQGHGLSKIEHMAKIKSTVEKRHG